MTSGAEAQYPVMALAEILALPVDRVLAPAAVVWLWVPVPLLPWGITVLHAWGAPYRTALFWHKVGRLGLGFWYRNQVEILLMGVRGRVTPCRSAIRNLYASRPDRHSQKPDWFQHTIQATLAGPYLELFARRPLPGWTTVGADLGHEVHAWLSR